GREQPQRRAGAGRDRADTELLGAVARVTDGLGLGAVLLGVDPALDLVGGDDGLLGSCVRPGRPSWSRAYRRVRGRTGKPAAEVGTKPSARPLHLSGNPQG